MAIFGRKKADDPAKPEPGADAPAAYAPEKAARFFEHARTVHETTNYDYAMQLWLSGMRQDPSSMRAFEGFMASAIAFLNEQGKPSKELLRGSIGKSDVDRYLNALLQWALKPSDPGLGVAAVESAAKAGLGEQSFWIGERVLNAVARDKKPRKDHYLRLMEAFRAVGAFDKAVMAGEAAVRLDPADAKLSTEVRNLSAQATMSKGGYERSGQSGAFRENIRDLDKQRQLEDAEKIVKTEETVDRLVQAASDDYDRRPSDTGAIRVYVKRLLERGRPEDENRALEVLRVAFKDTGQFMFRQTIGDISLRRARRALSEAKSAAQARPDDPGAGEALRVAAEALLRQETEEYAARVEAYPTDLGLKYELGKRYLQGGNYEKAIEMFQASKDDARHRSASLSMLGQAFLKIDFRDEAILTFRQALAAHQDHSDATGMELRYGLMAALQSRAESDRDLKAAEEADQIASSIAIQSISYRDIVARRQSIKKLLAALRAG